MNTVEFWSSVEYGTFLRGLVRELRAVGWQAEQRYLVEERQYRAASDASSRFMLRFRSYLLYPGKLHYRVLMERKPSVLVVCTNTFYAPTVAISAARLRGIPVVHWIFDLYPDVLVHAGKVKAGGFFDFALAQLTRYALRHASANVFLGKHVRDRAEQRFRDVPRSTVIPVGGDGQPFGACPPAETRPSEPVKVLYCGNLGRMHDVDTVLELLHKGAPEGFQFQFRANGIGVDALREEVRGRGEGDRVTLGPSLLEDEWVRTMTDADVALVTLKSRAAGLGMPSKTYSAMLAGQAILAICPRDSDLADVVLEHDAGWVIEPGNEPLLRETLTRIARDRGELHAKRLNAFRAGREHFDQQVLAHRWAGLLDDVVGPKPPGSSCAIGSLTDAR